MSRFRSLIENMMDDNKEDYTKYIEELLKSGRVHEVLSFNDWCMQNDETYRDDVLDNDSYYQDGVDDTTNQEKFDDMLDRYNIAGING